MNGLGKENHSECETFWEDNHDIPLPWESDKKSNKIPLYLKTITLHLELFILICHFDVAWFYRISAEHDGEPMEHLDHQQKTEFQIELWTDSWCKC